LSSKRTFNQVPAKTALVLTGSAIALASYLGASSNDAGHDGHGAEQTGLAAALTASRQTLVAGTISTGTIGQATSSLETINTGTSGLGAGLESGGTVSISGPGPIALTAYGTPRKHRRPPLRYPQHHRKHHPKRLQTHHAVRHQHPRKHPARRHWGRLHGNPWRIAGSLMPAYHWTSWQFHYLNLLWMRESGWNRFAYNHSSGAYGIPQAMPGDKMAAAGPDWRTSARTQIIWGMGYIRSRYGDPWNAWQHELRYGWY
jgi:hypothetical protein